MSGAPPEADPTYMQSRTLLAVRARACSVRDPPWGGPVFSESGGSLDRQLVVEVSNPPSLDISSEKGLGLSKYENNFRKALLTDATLPLLTDRCGPDALPGSLLSSSCLEGKLPSAGPLSNHPPLRLCASPRPRPFFV